MPLAGASAGDGCQHPALALLVLRVVSVCMREEAKSLMGGWQGAHRLQLAVPKAGFQLQAAGQPRAQRCCGLRQAGSRQQWGRPPLPMQEPELGPPWQTQG